MLKPQNVAQYIAGFPPDIQEKLNAVRSTIKKAAPNAEEVISYNMPAYKLNGMLLWFAAHSKHIGIYPRVSGIEAFKKELSIYKSAKGSVQFPHNQKLPLALIAKIVRFRVNENTAKAKAKKKSLP